MRKRGKARVVWLPPNTDNDAVLSATEKSSTIAGQLHISASALFDSLEFPITLDAPIPLDTANASLADIESSGFRLRRIVGKIWLASSQIEDSDVFKHIVTAGFMVRRVDQGGNSLASANPIEINPIAAESTMDPWIWRRSWLLGNNLSLSKNAVDPTFPETNQFFAALDGPHIDQKTARLIGPEERLFLDVGCAAIDLPEGQADITVDVNVIAELRILGSMRTSSGNRRNASR